ncbi:MAG: MFS transporter [Chitinophagaceae bacterium]|nr:MFS transporter [Chitinophagaceae bacterium]
MTNDILQQRKDSRNAVLAGFLGWTLDAFDFFIVTFVLGAIAKDFDKSIPEMALTITATLSTRPIGAFIFGLMADKYGRRLPLMISIAFYSLIEVLCGFAPGYSTFLFLRLLYGIGMGGEWGVGASLVMESVSVKKRGFLSGLLQEGYAVGFLIAAAVYYLVFPHFGWRVMFFIGGIPALVTLFIRSRVKETEAWKKSKSANWKEYGKTVKKHWKLFVYLVILMSIMNLMSHGTQDMYPTFLQEQRHFDVHGTSIVAMISMVGAIFGGLFFGHFSDKWGRRRSMIIASVLGLLMIPFWVNDAGMIALSLGAFGMQFMVQGAWGVIPAHINELSPGSLRGFFPGFAYQLGVLVASGVAYVEAVMAKALSYSVAMEFLAASVFVLAIVVISLGRESRGVQM